MPKLPVKIQKAVDKAELSTGGTMVPEGVYRAKCFEIDTGHKSAAGNPTWVFKFNEFTPGDDLKGDPVSGEIWEFCALTEEAAWKLKQIMSSMGFTPDSDSDELIGEYVGAVVQHGLDNKDKMRANVAWYFDMDEVEEQLAQAG